LRIVLPWNSVHIPDGFLSTPVWLTLDVTVLPAVAVLARRARRELEEARAPLLGVMGAFVFAAQMINFPVAAGTSAHLVGGALLAITLGPAAASVVMTAILVVQAFVFQDGGILALGANVFNMGIAGVLAAWLPYHLWGAGTHRRTAIFAAGALSVVVSALLAVSELLASGVPVRQAALVFLLVVFGVSAAIEGVITVAVVRGIERLIPRIVRHTAPERSWGLAVCGAGAVLLAAAGGLVASTNPDGLQWLGGQLDILGRITNLFTAPLAEYRARWLSSPWIAKAAAGTAGALLVGLICIALGRAAARPRSA
jgi:cobalt/nickel transport system permease protein